MATTTSIDLCACPFCSGRAKITEVRRGNYRREGSNFQGLCNKCKARGPLVQDDADEAARQWNASALRSNPGVDTPPPDEKPLSARLAAEVVGSAIAEHLSLRVNRGDFTDPNRRVVKLLWGDTEVASASFDVTQQREYEG